MTAPSPKDPKPIVRTGIYTEYGELLDDPASLLANQDGSADVTNVPGFSDMRRARDLAIAKKEKAPFLPVNLRWFRRTKSNGQPTNERTVIAEGKDYKPVLASQIGKEAWITGMPRGATQLPDGTIGTSDMQLMVQTASAAAKSEYRKKVKWLELNTASAKEAFEKAGQRAPGSNPEVSTERGPELSK